MLGGLLGGTIVGLAVALIVNIPILAVASWVGVLTAFPGVAHVTPAWLIPSNRAELVAPFMATLYAVVAGTAALGMSRQRGNLEILTGLYP